MNILAEQTLNGVVYGIILFLLSVGLALIFGMLQVVSLAHGSFFMLGAFVAFATARATGSFWLALLASPLAVAAVGIVVERWLLRPLYHRGHLEQVLLTFGLTFIVSDVVKFVWGNDIHALPAPALLSGGVAMGGATVPIYRLFLVVTGCCIAGALWLALERSRIGAMVRASVDDRVTASGLGIDVERLFSGVFALSAGLAALGGVLAAPVLGVYPGLDGDILIPAFIVVVIGGMSSPRGAFLGSMLVGEVDTYGKAFLPTAALFLIYGLMILVLLTRPSGLFAARA